MRYKSGIRWFLFLLTTAICGACGYLIYLSAESGELYKSTIKDMFLRMIILIAPCILSCILGSVYHAESGEIEFSAVAISVNFFLPIIGSICAAGEFFGVDPKWYFILQIAIPLFLTYLMCLQCIICPNKPPTSYYSSSYTDNRYDSYYSNSNSSDCGAYGFPAGSDANYLPDNLKGPY